MKGNDPGRRFEETLILKERVSFVGTTPRKFPGWFEESYLDNCEMAAKKNSDRDLAFQIIDLLSEPSSIFFTKDPRGPS